MTRKQWRMGDGIPPRGSKPHRRSTRGNLGDPYARPESERPSISLPCGLKLLNLTPRTLNKIAITTRLKKVKVTLPTLPPAKD